jgi:hypothetical protein
VILLGYCMPGTFDFYAGWKTKATICEAHQTSILLRFQKKLSDWKSTLWVDLHHTNPEPHGRDGSENRLSTRDNRGLWASLKTP